MPQATPKHVQISPKQQAAEDLRSVVLDACVAALGERTELPERDEIALAQAIVADFAARGVRVWLYHPRDLLRQIIKERQEQSELEG